MGSISFSSLEDYLQKKTDTKYWWPHITQILSEHNIKHEINQEDASVGVNSTYPVFISLLQVGKLLAAIATIWLQQRLKGTLGLGPI